MGRYCLLSIDLFRLRLEEEDKDEGEGDPSDVSEPSEGDLACSFKKARNSAGAISGCRLAGTQKRWKGSSDAVFGASASGLLPVSRLWSEDELPSLELPAESVSALADNKAADLSVGELGDQKEVGDEGDD